jgi:hypothetical protein
VLATVDAIARVQLPTATSRGPGGHTDPWNLVEAAMALDVGGVTPRPSAAYEWLRRCSARRSWHAYYRATR